MAVHVLVDIYTRIRKEVEAAGPDADPSDIARDVMRLVSRDDLFPLVVDQIKKVQRFRVATMERHIFTRLEPISPRPMPTGLSAKEKIEQLKSLLKEKIALGDGVTVRWGQATIEQLRQRLEMVNKQTNGLMLLRRNLEASISILAATGARCLDEVH